MLRIVVASVRMISLATKGEVRSKVPKSGTRKTKEPAVGDHPNEHRTGDVEQDIDPSKELPGNQRPQENLLFIEKLGHAQLPFQHHVEKTRRIAFANDRLPCLTANLSSRRKTRTLGSVELRKKRDVKNRCERPIETADDWIDGGDSISSKPSVSSALYARFVAIA